MIQYQLRPKRLSRAERAARKAAWQEGRAFKDRRRYGTLGAASPCRRICPATGAVIGLVERHQGEQVEPVLITTDSIL